MFGAGTGMRSRSAAIPHWYTPGREVLTVTRGSGARVVDDEDREYLDFTAQLYCCNAGHSNEAIIEAMTEQLQRIPYVSPSKANDTRSALAAELTTVGPDPLEAVFFAISGSEANEAAAQIAREYTGASKILTRWRSYHGATTGAAAFTGDPTTRAALEAHAATTGSGKFLPPLGYHSPFPAETPEELGSEAADHLEFVIRNEGPDAIAGILTEIVGGTSGAYTGPPGYFPRVRELCDEYDILLIADEVITGFGRCGDWFAAQTEGVDPDLLTFAKGVTSAYAPLAGVLLRGDIAASLRTEGIDVGQTFAGHPVACAAGLAALDEYRNGLIDSVRSLEPVLESALTDLAERHAVIGDVRGRGLLWAIEFTDPDTGEPFVHPWVSDEENPVDEVIAAAEAAGLLIGSGRPNVQVILAPPFCIDRDDVETAVQRLETAIDQAFG